MEGTEKRRRGMEKKTGREREEPGWPPGGVAREVTLGHWARPTGPANTVPATPVSLCESSCVLVWDAPPGLTRTLALPALLQPLSLPDSFGSGMEALCPRVRQGRRGSVRNRLKGVLPTSDLGLELWPPYPSSQ